MKNESLINARKLKGYSQKELAEIVGTQQHHISCYENGKYEPSIQMMFRICEALQVDPEEVFKK